MGRGKHLSLEEARNSGKLKQFAKEHPSEADAERFTQLLDLACKSPPKSSQTSSEDASED